MRTTRPALRLTTLALGALLTLSTLTGCGGDGDADGGGGGGGGSTSAEANQDDDRGAGQDDRDPSEVLGAAADATLDARRFTIDSEADLDINGMDLSFGSEGSIDYDAAISDNTLSVEQGGETQSATILADGDSLWVTAEGSSIPAFPDGATYLQGDASQLSEDDNFSPDQLLGIVLVLRGGAEADPEAGDTDEVDGVETRAYTFTVPYDEAVAAVTDPDEQAAFTDALSLTGEADQADLEVEVAIGVDDDVVRRLSLDIQADVPVDGGYELELTDVGEEVEPPDAPDADEIATGPEADALLEQLLSS